MNVPTDVAPGPPTDILTEAHHTIANPAQGATAMICHTEDHSLHIGVPLHIQEISHSRHRTSHRPSKVSSHSHRTPKHHEVRCKRVIIDDPLSDHFSSEDSSNSDETLN